MIQPNKSHPTCQACAWGSNKLQAVRPFGQGAIPLLIVGDYPDFQDAVEGRPFSHRTAAGSILVQVAKKAGYTLDQFWLIHALNCVPPYEKPEKSQATFPILNQCRAHLHDYLSLTKPKCILALGDLAVTTTTGYSGRKQTAKDLNGYVLDSLLGIPVVAAISPDAVLTSGKPALKESLIVAFLKAVHLAKNGGQFERPSFASAQLFPSPAAISTLPIQAGDVLMVDIETPYSTKGTEDELKADSDTFLEDPLDTDDLAPAADTSLPPTVAPTTAITQVQYGTATLGELQVHNWTAEVAAHSKELFNRRPLVAGWNIRNFDNPILRQHGLSISQYLDLMNMWHRYKPDLPMGLQFATSYFMPFAKPWKHLHHSDPGDYGVMDITSMQAIYQGLKMQMEKIVSPDTGITLLQSFLTHDVPLQYALDRIQQRGYPVDRERLTQFKEELAAQIQANYDAMLPLFPEEIVGAHSDFYYDRPAKLKQGFAEEDLVQVEREVPLRYNVARLRDNKSLRGKPIPPEIKAAAGQPWETATAGLEPKLVEKWLKKETHYSTEPVPQMVWAYRRTFNPNSRDQILAYLRYKIEEEFKEFAAHDAKWNGQGDPRGYKTNHLWEIPKDPNDPQKDWIGAKGLSRLNAKLAAAGKPDPFLTTLITNSKVAKMRSAFAESPAWQPTDANLVHTTFKLNPATGQLAAVAPNVLQCFSGDTEVLTPNGWERFDKYTEGTPVAQYHLDGRIEFVVPDGYVKQTRSDVIEITTQEQINLCVTSDHRCLVRDRRTGKTKVVRADEFPKDMQQICAGEFVGGQLSLRESQLTIIAALQADGHAAFAKRAIRPTIDFKLSRPRKIKRLMASLEAENIPFHLSNIPPRKPHHAPLTRITINPSNVPSWLTKEHKYFGPWILTLTKECFKFLAAEIFHWDGGVDRCAYVSKHESNVNWAQILQVLSGRRAVAKSFIADRRTGNSYWRIDTCDRKYAATANHTVTPQHEQTVYCVSVPSTFIVVRRNGRVAMTGQSPKHGKVSKQWRRVLRAHPGRRWVSLDFSGFHALTTGFEANDPSYIRAARIDIHGILGYIKEKLPEWERLVEGLRDPVLMSDEEIAQRVKKWARANAPVELGKTFKERRDKVYKTCIAEGTPILTDKGLVPIEKITLEHRLWDGVEWVHHDGIIDQGIQPVITWDGLTATPDHLVFTANGQAISIGRAAHQMDRLERTGNGGTPIRTLHRDLLRDSAHQRLQEAAMQMRMWNGGVGGSAGTCQWNVKRMSNMRSQRSNLFQAARNYWGQIRCYSRSLLESIKPKTSALWGAGDRMSIFFAEKFCALGHRAFAASFVSGRGNRPDQQRWPLRAWKLETSHPPTADGQSEKHQLDSVSRDAYDITRICNSVQPLHLQRNCKVWQERTDWGANNSSGIGLSSQAQMEVAPGSRPMQRARVFDIANAGPRFCFTAAGKLVANCVLGVQFGMRPRKMFNLNPDVFLSQTLAQEVWEIEASIWPRIFEFQDEQRQKAAAPPHYLMTRYGYVRWFYSVYTYEYDRVTRQMKTRPGPDSEKAVAFAPANDAFGHVRDTIIWLDTQLCPRTGLSWAEKFGLVNNVHDSLEFHCPSPHVEELLDLVGRLMQRRNRILSGPAAPEGLWCGAEAEVGQENEGMDTCEAVAIPAGPFDFDILSDIGWRVPSLEKGIPT